jgi:cytochrome c-type biogenesis protein CcmH/NrfG/glutathione synthase/RimK-type ligase-like ATP-grasp enzyme
MKPAQTRHEREAALEEIANELSISPDAIDLRFRYASLLAQMGRAEEAKAAYLEVLARDPAHFGALNDLGNLLYATSYTQAASTLYTEAIKQQPTNPKGYVNLANLLMETQQPERAREHFEAALRLAPDLPEANRGLAYLLTESRQEEEAETYRQKAFQNQPLLVMPYHGDDPPIKLLVLVSASGGVIPMRHHFDPSIFLVSVLFVEFFQEEMTLPPHHIVFNTIGDADLCEPALHTAAQILTKTNAPVINAPNKVLRTGRMGNAETLGRLPHVVTPKMTLFSRERWQDEDFEFPLLLRAPGYHTGRFFARVESAHELADTIASMPGQEVLAIQYLDTRSRDGKIRKYRVMMIGGKLYPLHAAISHEWKIHYFTAEMADHPEHRAEDAAFLDDMASVLGPNALHALEEICRTLGLDYGGIDFSLNSDGDVILFEANASMVVYPPEADPRWDYRRPAVQRILDAIRALLT